MKDSQGENMSATPPIQPPPLPPMPYNPNAGRAPVENILRGTLFALIAIPAGVVVWTIIWSIGVVASIVALGVAYAAVWLYLRGSGGVVSRVGAFIISGIVLVTLLLSFWVGLVVDYIRAQAEYSAMPALEVFQHPQFWNYFGEDLPAILESQWGYLLLALAFGVLGSFTTLRRTFQQAKAGGVQPQQRRRPAAAPTSPKSGSPSLEDLYAAPAAPAPTAAPTAPRPATPRYGQYAPPVTPPASEATGTHSSNGSAPEAGAPEPRP